MRECSYEVYVSVYTAVREGIAHGDRDVASRVGVLLSGRTGVTALVSTLAMIEARRGDPRRQKVDVCDGVLCDRRCGRASKPGRVRAS